MLFNLFLFHIPSDWVKLVLYSGIFQRTNSITLFIAQWSNSGEVFTMQIEWQEPRGNLYCSCSLGPPNSPLYLPVSLCLRCFFVVVLNALRAKENSRALINIQVRGSPVSSSPSHSFICTVLALLLFNFMQVNVRERKRERGRERRSKWAS